MIKKYTKLLALDMESALFLAVSVVCFAVQADFAPGGVTGLAVLTNYLTGFPIGWATILINVPLVLLTYKRLGRDFFVFSVKTVLICSLFTDYIAPLFPVFEGGRLIASVFSGIFAGIGYSIVFNAGSSTAGTDFIIVAVKQVKPKMSFGLLAFLIDSTVIVVSVFVFKQMMSFVYGMVYTVVTSLALDATTFLIKKSNLSLT